MRRGSEATRPPRSRFTGILVLRPCWATPPSMRTFVTFATELSDLHRAMLRYYVQMRYLTPAEAETFRRGRIPLLTPLRATRRHPAEEGRPSPLHGSAARRPVRCAAEHLRPQHPSCPRLPGSHRTVSNPVGPRPRARGSPPKRGGARLGTGPDRRQSSWNGAGHVSWSMTGRSHPCWRAFTSRRCTR